MSSIPQPPSPRARILVVEDHEDVAEVLCLHLACAGHAPTSARDGVDALLAVRDATPDLVLLDVNLPRVDGFTVLERLRDSGVWCPVLMLSARGSAEDKLEGFRLGADDYVTKPFTVAELLARVAAHLRRAAMVPAIAAQAVAPPMPMPPRDVVGYTDEGLVARFGLTSRQAAVARLLAAGLTNPEIAATLGISRFTARNHAEAVIAKVGVTSRGRVAAALRAAYDADCATAS